MSKILLGVSGSIAISKVPQLVSDLSKKHEVRVMMTETARRFIQPELLQYLSKHKVYYGHFAEYDKQGEQRIAHIELAKWADIILLAPATANILAKLAHGICDDLLTSTVIASRSQVLIAPAMNTCMLNNPATRKNLEILQTYGYQIIPTESGDLACGDFGDGKLSSLTTIEQVVTQALEQKPVAEKPGISQDLQGLSVIVTAGPTEEPIDPVRFITNRSSGKMGYAVAQNALDRGAEVLLISGPVSIDPPKGQNLRLIKVEKAMEMQEAILQNIEQNQVLVMTAAVADYRVKTVSSSKIKKNNDSLNLELVKNPDILDSVSKRTKGSTTLVGFSMETENLISSSEQKLKKKNLDLIVANSISQSNSAFGSDYNQVSLISAEGINNLPRLTKYQVAEKIWDRVMEIRKEKERRV